MSTHAPAAQADHGNCTGFDSGSLGTYLTGLLLAAGISVLAFWLVLHHEIDGPRTAMIVLTVLAVMRLVVHVTCFLRVNSRTEEGWSVLALMFTAVVVVVVMIGSLWVMYHLNSNTLPAGMNMGTM